MKTKSIIALAVVIILSTTSTLLVSCKKAVSDKEVETILTTETQPNCNHPSHFTGEYEVNADGDLIVNANILIRPLKVSDGNVRYTIVHDGVVTPIITYHTSHESIDEMVNHLWREFDENYKGNLVPFKYE